MFSSNDNSSFPNTTKNQFNQEFFTMNNINNQNNVNISNTKNSGNKTGNINPSQNSILNDYNNFSKKLLCKSKFKANASYNPTGTENVLIGNNGNNSNSQSNKNTKENFSVNKLSNKVSNANSLSINYNNANITLNTNNSNAINRKGNASPYKNDQKIIQKTNLGISGKNMELNFNQLNSTNKNSRNKSNNHNYNSTNINNTNQSTIKNNMNNIYATNFIDANNNNIIGRNGNNKIFLEKTLKFSGTIQENNTGNYNLGANNIQKLIQARLENTMNLAQANDNRNSNSKAKFNYDILPNQGKSNVTHNSGNAIKSKTPTIFNANKIESLDLNTFNVLNTDSDINGEQNNNLQNTKSISKNQKSKSINIIGKSQGIFINYNFFT